MTKSFKYVKGNLRRSDKLRPLLTDTTPYEVPVIFSNDGFYRNLTSASQRSAIYQNLINALITENKSHYTIPHRYMVAKDESSLRGLSLPHPYAQINTCDFYADYESLITYYCSRGRYSMRRPIKPGSTFYFKSNLSGENAYKKDSIETQNLDQITRNPASYFSYSGHSRLHKFFSSRDYVRLEKKFSKMHLLDVSKCFASIYTHSISWAIKGDQHSKDNRKAVTFGGQFDELMQKMNYNETAGICIGPEVSRIFAEVILNRIDSDIDAQALLENLHYGSDYEIRRYVDDYIVFCNSEATAKALTRIISASLSRFKLNLNEQKIKKYERPFLTEKSHTILAAHQSIQQYLDSFLDSSDATVFPKKIFRSKNLLQSLLNSLKVSCIERGVTYDSIANFVISVLTKRIERITADFSAACSNGLVDHELYPPALKAMLEAAFFMYTVNPTVASSYTLSRAILIASNHVTLNHSTFSISFLESISLWGRQLISTLVRNRDISAGKVPIEAINIILACATVDKNFLLEERHLGPLGISVDDFGYFNVISGLYLARDRPEGTSLKARIKIRIYSMISDGPPVRRDSERLHLLLDTLACPYLEVEFRRSILQVAMDQLSLDIPTPQELDNLLAEFLTHSWFVDWTGINLLTMVQKKELSSVY